MTYYYMMPYMKYNTDGQVVTDGIGGGFFLNEAECLTWALQFVDADDIDYIENEGAVDSFDSKEEIIQFRQDEGL